MSESNSNPSASASVSNENVVRILSLLRSGDEKLNFAGSHDAILVLGNTGSGKSTFTHFIAGNNDDLTATEVGENTGEFVIVDTNNKISVNNTVISKTLIPERIINRETKLVAIDCPGFGDSGRNEAYDIAAAFFIKKVLENVKKVKIVLTVSYPSLRKGVNRNDFLQLLDHTTVLIKHIEKYVDGVALIATKVDNTYNVRNKVPVLVSDSAVLQNMAQFLLEVKESIKSMKNLNQVYQSESKRVKDELFFKSSDKLLTALLQKNGTEYPRLGIFRRPDAPGRLSQSELLQGEKKVILDMLKNNLNYVPVDITDIGYAVSDKSKNVISDLVAEIDRTIVSDMAGLNDVLVNYFEKLEVKMLNDDMYLLIKLLKNASKALVRISSIQESARADQLASLTRKNLPESCKPAAEPFLEDMTNLGKFYNFLQDVSDKQFESMGFKWIKELQGSINFVENSIKWYDFLAALHQRLSQYDIQKRRPTERLLVPEFESTSISLGSNRNFTNFLNEISDSNFLKVVNYRELLKANMDDTKIEYFNRVVLSTLGDRTNFVTDHRSRFANFDDDNSSSRFLVTGEYVKLSELLDRVEYKLCESLQIFAKHSVFIDTDLRKNIDVSIIAPRWVIIGANTIDLSGAPGLPHAFSKAKNGNRWNGDRNGHNGRPGNPGESAGHFFGIGNVFENMENLTIRAIGGVGGNGQDGGDGAPGNDGISRSIAYNQYYLRCYEGEECLTEINYSKSGLFNLKVEGDIKYFRYGSPGGRGGDAGHGGAPGIGGLAGNITLLGTGDAKPSISAYVGQGNRGEFGLHGDCGLGGSGGTHYKATYYFGTWSSTKNYVDSLAGRAADGSKGTCLYYSSTNNSNDEGLKQPSPKEFLYPPALAITDFRKELTNDLNDSVKKHHALEFYKALQNKEIIQYDKPELIFQELATLEMFHNQLAPDVARILYTLLLERVRENYKTIQNLSTSKDHKTLEFLALAINSQLLRLESKSDLRQISNLQSYLDLLKTTDVVKIRQFFTARVKDGIKSIEHMIGILNGDIFDTIERTTNEIIQFSEQDTNNELGDQLLKFKLFTNLRTIGDFLMFCGSLAEADLALVNTLQVKSTLPKLQLDVSPVGGNQIVENLSTIEETFEHYVDAIRSSILKERMILKSLAIEYDEMCDQLQDADMVLQSRKPLTNKSYVYPPYFSTSDVVQRVRSINKVLSNYPSIEARDAANKFDQDLKLIEFSTELYIRLLAKGIDSSNIISHMQNLQKSASLNDGIEDRATRIDKTVSEIFDAMSPVLHATKSSLMGNLYKPDGLKELRIMTSQAVSQVRLIFFQLIDGFDIDEDLQLAIENIDECFSMMNSIFNDVLLSHHDRASFNTFYSHLKKEAVSENSVHEYSVKVINANALFYEYERSIELYQKYISPFDVSTSDNPPVPNIDETQLSTYRSLIESNVKILETKLNSFNENSSDYTLSDEFNSSNRNGPFYTWRSQNYEQSISKLLRGKRIALKATNVNKNFGFLKFDDIRLSFRSDDPFIQQSLDEDLFNFNVIMTHSGRSYFNLCDRVQLVNQDTTRFIYKVNETLTEIDDPDAGSLKPHLSPFTTWIFKLKPVNENVTFSSLLRYRKTNIDILLEGNATYVDLQNKTVCQNILRNGPLIDVDSSDNTEMPKLTRKRRDVDSSESISDTSFKNLYNPFFNRIADDSDPRFDHSSNPKLDGSTYEPNQSKNFLSSLNMNAALTFFDFLVRNVTKVKPYQSMEKSVSPDEARVIALNILDAFENMLNDLAQDHPTLLPDWEKNNPIELICQLEKYVLRREYSKIIDVLSQSVTLKSSLEEEVRRELSQVVEGSVHRNVIEVDSPYSRLSDGLLCNQSNDSSNTLNGNFSYSLLD